MESEQNGRHSYQVKSRKLDVLFRNQGNTCVNSLFATEREERREGKDKEEELDWGEEFLRMRNSFSHLERNS